jgi:two-component system, NtrC family, nitrogen regulation response regulator GlnG
VTVTLPPLRERREDIAPLFLRLLHDVGGGRTPAVDSKLIETLLLYDWPLNIRELVLLARRMVAMHRAEPTLKRSMLPERMAAATPSMAPPPDARVERSPTADDAAFEQFLLALRTARGNVSRAAASLGISRARAYRLLEARPGFDVRSLRDEDEP